MDRFSSSPVTLPLTPSPYPADEAAAPITVNGTGLPAALFDETRARDHTTRWLMAAIWLLLVIFGLGAAGAGTLYVGAAEGAFLWAIWLVALGVALVGQHYRRTAARRQDLQARRLYTAAVAGGVVTTVYPDRIEQVSARLRQTVFFTADSRFVENERWLFVETGEQRAVIAAADVTPWEAQAIFEHIARAIPPARQFTTGRFAARCAQPSPPPFSHEPPVCYERVVYREEARHGIVWPHGLLPWLFAVSLVIGSMFTVLFQITASFFLDYLLIFTACFVGTLVAALAVLLYKNHGTPAGEVALSFTADGLLIERSGQQQFAAAADIYARRTADGARLFTPAGVFTVPWSAVQHRQQLEWMLFHQRPTSF